MPTRREPPLLSDLDYANLARFRFLLRGFFEFSEAAAREAGVTPSQHQLLLAVRGHPGPGEPNISDMAASLCVRHHSAVELVARTERLGLVRRVSDPDDRRQHRLALTEKGRAVLGSLAAIHRDELTRLRTDLIGLLADLG